MELSEVLKFKLLVKAHTISVSSQVTASFSQIGCVFVKKEGRLPPYLFLQMDNCYRECKNRYILGFCSLLVERGIFKEVRNLLGEATTELIIHFYFIHLSA